MNRLMDLEVGEVSLVRKGANRRKYLILKAEEEGVTMDDILKAVLDTPLENESKVVEEIRKAGLSDKAAGAVKGALRMLNGYKDELPQNMMKMMADLGGYDYPAPAEKDKVAKEKDCIPAPVKKADGTYDFSGIPEGVRPMVEALWKQNEEAVKKADELDKVLKAERDERLTKEYIAKAAEYTHLPVKFDEFGLVLKGLAEKAPEEYQKVEALLKAANEGLAKSKLFSEVGSGHSELAGSAQEKLEKMAESLVQKDANSSRADAIARIAAEHPELYAEYSREVAVRV